MDSKTRAKLRSIANTLQTEVLVGQSGITDNVLEQIKMNLVAHEIVKIGLLNNSDLKAPRTQMDAAKAHIHIAMRCELTAVFLCTLFFVVTLKAFRKLSLYQSYFEVQR